VIDLTRKLDPTRLVTFVIGTDMAGDRAVSLKLTQIYASSNFIII